MTHVNEIMEVLDSVSNEYRNSHETDSTWTRDIKDRLSILGKKYHYSVYASSASEATGGEWLYDLTWLRYNNNNLISVELSLESEWSFDGINDDFQKLLLVKAELRTLNISSKK